MANKRISYARDRRKKRTRSEGLLWSLLRARQLCGLKFRREHPIGIVITDFACEAKKLVIEIDGGYHDQTIEQDIAREKIIRQLGWEILRFSDKEVVTDAEAVCRAIAKHLQLDYAFQRRRAGGSGLRAGRCEESPSPNPRTSDSTLPTGG